MVRFYARESYFSLLLIVKIGSETHPFKKYRKFFFSGGQKVWNMKLTACLHVVPWLRISRAISPLPNMPSVHIQGRLHLALYRSSGDSQFPFYVGERSIYC